MMWCAFMIHSFSRADMLYYGWAVWFISIPMWKIFVVLWFYFSSVIILVLLTACVLFIFFLFFLTSTFQLPCHIEILVAAITQINEPDSLYGIIQSHKVSIYVWFLCTELIHYFLHRWVDTMTLAIWVNMNSKIDVLDVVVEVIQTDLLKWC